jgi:hypothetical protein
MYLFFPCGWSNSFDLSQKERDRQKVAYHRTYYDAQYFLDCGDGIDNEVLFVCTIP